MTERPFPKDAIKTSVIKSAAANPEYARQIEEVGIRLLREHAEGRIRTDISCIEARKEWLIMARNTFVNRQDARWPIDAELGIHLASCDEDPCQNLYQVYLGVLRSSQPEDASRISEIVDKLEENMFG